MPDFRATSSVAAELALVVAQASAAADYPCLYLTQTFGRSQLDLQQVETKDYPRNEEC